MADRPEGLPAYGWESLLELADMATVTMLKRKRRELAPGAKPVGCYWSGHDWVLLYKASEAVAMPPLPPGRQRLYDRNRTCAECGKRALDPFELGNDGKRYCSPCQGPVHERLWLAERHRDRPIIARWASGVLDDPTVILGAEHRHQWYRQVRVEDMAGAVLLDAKVRYRADDVLEPGTLDRPEFADTVSPTALVDTVRALSGRRLVTWWRWSGPSLTTEGLTAAVEDALGHWYSRWVGKLAGGSYRYHPRLAEQPPPWEPVEQVARMRELLAEMAAP